MGLITLSNKYYHHQFLSQPWITTQHINHNYNHRTNNLIFTDTLTSQPTLLRDNLPTNNINRRSMETPTSDTCHKSYLKWKCPHIRHTMKQVQVHSRSCILPLRAKCRCIHHLHPRHLQTHLPRHLTTTFKTTHIFCCLWLFRDPSWEKSYSVDNTLYNIFFDKALNILISVIYSDIIKAIEGPQKLVSPSPWSWLLLRSRSSWSCLWCTLSRKTLSHFSNLLINFFTNR